MKLMAALGVYLGWQQTLVATFFGVVSAAVYALCLLGRGKAGRKDRFAFGPFLCAGAGLAMFFGENLLGWYLSLW